MPTPSQFNDSPTVKDSRDPEHHADARALAELIGLAAGLNTARSFDNLLDNFSRGLQQVWPGAGVRIFEIDREADYLIPLDSHSTDPISLSGSLLGRIVFDCHCTLVKDLNAEPQYLRGKEAPPGVKWLSVIAGPITTNSKPSHVAAVFLPEEYAVQEQDRIHLQRAVTLLEPLISRWRSQEVQLEAFHAIARAISMAVDARDPHMVGHGERVSEFAQAVARAHGLEIEYVKRLGLAGLLHDIGRLGIPERILFKPGPLTPDEFRVIRAHPVLSVRFLEKVDYISDIMDAIRHHHERYDGGGYPDGFEDDKIPLGARILTVTDAFDAMTSPRPFRDARSDADALAELQREKGGQFDPIIVEAFMKAHEDKLIISQNVLRADDPLSNLRFFNG